jgi:hypothetical protein
MLLAIAGAMIALGVIQKRDIVLEAEHWRPVWLSDPVSWLAGVLAQQFWLAAAFALLGVLVPLAMGVSPRMATSRARWLVWLAVGAVLAVAVRGARSAGLPGAAELFVPLVGFFVGAWLADRWVRRDFSWRRPLFSFVMALLVMVGLAAIVVPLAISGKPLDIPDAEASDEAKQRVADLINESRPEGADDRTLRLSEADLNTLVGVALSRGGAQRRGRVRLEDDVVHAEASVRLPRGMAEAAYGSSQKKCHTDIDLK